MLVYDIIRKKRDGYELTDEEIAFFIEGYTKGVIPDYQAAALCMAIFFSGMTDRETVKLTQCMAESGDTLDLSRFGTLSADKHSTGGVGDKTTLIVAPIVASLGGKVAKMSGRGLGHTGGTVDKLESIPGYRTSLSPREFLDQVEKTGIAVIGQNGNLTPADKKLYALRDVTATIDSIPLITSSIMSKKLAAGSKNIVLDVKVGSGAFMKTPAEAELLAKNMVTIGKSSGRNIAAVLTNMDVPLGHAVGNALEVREAIEVLRGGGAGDLREVAFALAEQLVSLVKNIPVEEAGRLVNESVASGKAIEKMREWIAAQGGDVRFVDDTSLFTPAKYVEKVVSDRDGFIDSLNAERFGIAGVVLGAGRKEKDAPVDHAAGIIIHKKTGDRVTAGEAICSLYTNDPGSVEAAANICRAAVTFGSKPVGKAPLIYGVIR